MPRQEEIHKMKLHVGSLITLGQMKETDKLWPTVDAIFDYLHSQGVVRKADRELPKISQEVAGIITDIIGCKRDKAEQCRTAIFKYLDSQDVVRKVERELPKYIKTWCVRYPDSTDNSDPAFEDTYRPVTVDDMLKAGFVAVEPLIKKEVSNG